MFFRYLPILLLLSLPIAAWAEFPSTQDAMKALYPDARFVRKTIFLTPDQVLQIEKRLDKAQKLPSKIIPIYRVMRQQQQVATIYFDIHKVRTKAETLMIAVDRDNKIRRVEVIQFREPHEYLPRDAWLKRFAGQELSPQLQIKRDIPPIIGASLTARAVTNAARRILAIHSVVYAKGNSQP